VRPETVGYLPALGEWEANIPKAQKRMMVFDAQASTIDFHAQTSTIVSFENSQNAQHPKNWLPT
jgi:hypothetical protein